MILFFPPERKVSESVRTSETTPLHRPEETTLVHLKESQDWLEFLLFYGSLSVNSGSLEII